MTETKPKSSRQIAIRFDQESYERLQQMSEAAGENVVEIIRQLIARALADERSLELVAALGAVATRLTVLEQQQGAALPVLLAIHRRVTGLETLLCRIDENAVRRRAADHAIGWEQWSPVLSQIQALINGVFATMEDTKALHDHDRAYSLAWWNDLDHAAKEVFGSFRTKLQAQCAEIDHATPQPPQPVAPSREETQNLERLRAAMAAGASQERQRKERAADLDPLPIDEAEEKPRSHPASLNDTARPSISPDEGVAS